MLFLVESIIQGVSGGIVGFILGVIAAIFSAGFTTGFDIIFKVPMISMLFFLVGTTLLCVILTIIASMYPARRASTLSPVEALRYEL
jgi:ABC-type lipoprotein release transport system permease subunit